MKAQYTGFANFNPYVQYTVKGATKLDGKGDLNVVDSKLSNDNVWEIGEVCQYVVFQPEWMDTNVSSKFEMRTAKSKRLVVTTIISSPSVEADAMDSSSDKISYKIIGVKKWMKNHDPSSDYY